VTVLSWGCPGQTITSPYYYYYYYYNYYYHYYYNLTQPHDLPILKYVFPNAAAGHR